MKKTGTILDEWRKKYTVELSMSEEEIQEQEEAEARDRTVQIYREQYQHFFGARFVDKNFENYEIYAGQKQQAVLQKCKKYVRNLQQNIRDGYSLVFVGNSGNGKNHLLYTIARAIVDAHYQIELQPFYRLMREIKSNWNSKMEKEQDIIDRYINVDFLILEEIGIQYGSINEKVYLSEILDYRYKKCLPFILTSNLGTKKFREYIDLEGYNRNWDRLHEIAHVLIFDWESYREKQSKSQ